MIIESKPKGRFCLRCGLDFKENKGSLGGCKIYGTFYKRHLWNKKK